MILRKEFFKADRCICTLPNDRSNKISFAKKFVTYFFHVFNFMVVNRNKNSTICRNKIKRNFYTRINHI